MRGRRSAPCVNRRGEQRRDRHQVMEHQVASHLPRAVADAGEQQQSRGLNCRGGEHDYVCSRALLRAVRLQVRHAHRAASIAAAIDAVDEAARAELGPGADRLVQERDRAGARPDRAAKPTAEPARVANRWIYGHRDRVGGVAALRGAIGQQRSGEHRRVGRHRKGTCARCLGQCRLGHLADVTLDAEHLLDLVVERGEILVAERPVREVGAVDRPVQRAPMEVLAPQARRLCVPVDRASPDRGRQIVHIADERASQTLTRLPVSPKRARLQQRILLLEEPFACYLVSPQHRARTLRGPESVEQVTALLEHEDRVACAGQRPGGDAAAGSGSNDHDRLASHHSDPSSQPVSPTRSNVDL